MNAPWIHIILVVVLGGFITATGQTTDLSEEPILEVVFRMTYHNSDPYEAAVQVTDKPQKVTMKISDDLVVAKFEITPGRPCVATISIEADHIESASPNSWPVEVVDGSALYVTRMVGRHRYTIDVEVAGLGACLRVPSAT